MADINQLMTALRNADAAGDTAAAQRLAALIKQAQGGQTQPKPAAPAPQQRDGALMYGVDRMQQMVGKGIEVAGDLTGIEGVKQYGTDMAAQQEKDIAAGGYQPQYPGSLRENYNQGTFLPALGEKLLENAPSGGAAIAGTGLTAAAAALGAPAWLVFGGGAAVTAGSGLMGAGEAAMEMEEKTGSYDSKVAAGVGALVGFLDRFGAGKVIPVDRLAGMSADEVIKELSQKGFGEAAQAYAGRVTKAAAAEGATEVAQETAIVGGAASQGAEYTGQELADRAIDASVLGSAYGGGTRAVTELAPTANATREAGAQRLTELGEVINPVMIGNDPQAATELATRLDRIAKRNDLNLKDVNKQSTSGAREAIDKAHIQISEELKLFANDLRTQLDITDTDPLAVALDKVLAIAGRREARNKAKSTVGIEEMEAIDRLAGNTQEGQRLLSLMRQMNELTTLHNAGYIGGVSKITDQLSPMPSNVGYSDRSLIETPTRVLGTLYGASVNPLIPAVQTAAVIGGRGIDALTGRRSRIKRYISDNLSKNDGIAIDTDLESVRETRRQETEGIKKANKEQRARAKEIHKSQYEKNGDLPFVTLDAMLKERGLSPQRAVQLLEAMAAADPVIAADAQAMIKAIQEGGRTPNMTAVGAAMSTALDQQSTSVTRDKTPMPGAVQAAASSAAAPRDVSAGYVRGIQDNQAANTALIEAVDADPTISDDDKAVLIDALADLRSNLGANPGDRAMDIAAKAESQVSDPALVEAYVMPYVNRVIGQQASTQEETNFMAVPNFGEGLSVFPKTQALYKKIDGIEVDQGNYQAGSEDVTGNTYGGARVSIGENGRGRLEVDPEQSAAPDKKDGRRWHSNLVRPNLYEWVDNPQNLPQSFIVTVDHNEEGHQFALQYEADVPIELYRKALRIDGSKQDEPTMRPRGFGKLEYGRQIGTIKVKSSGRIAPIYDTIRIVPKQQPEINEMRTIGFMDNPPSIEGTGKKGVVTVDDVGRFLEAESIKAGSKAPRTVRGGKETNTIDYTDELKERLFQDILAEAKEFYKTNPGAAYWYTFGSPQALDMMSSVIPELREDPTSNNPDNGLPLQLLFWTLISPLSGGQNPVANAKLAVDVLRYYIENGRIPLSKYKGGLFINDANVDAKEAIGEELAWTARGSTTRNALAAIQKGIDTFGDLESFMMWMVSPHPAAEVTQMYMDLGFGSEESAKNIAKYADADGMVYGSQVLGAKFSPFLLNNSGNESKVTKDEWFTRSWNRLVGRMFTANGKEMLSQPSSPEERMVQDEVISRVAAELDLEPAQLQALWWAYEQQLYTKMGVNSPTRDYVDAATEVIKAIAGETEAANAEREGRARLSTLVAEQTQRAQGSNAAESVNRQQGVLDLDDGGNNGRAGDTELPKTSLAGSREPTPEENREALGVVQAAFEVGKPGSPYENGIRDYDTIEKIGQAFNHVFHLATSQTDLAKKLAVKRSKLNNTKGARVAMPSPEGYKLGRGARFGIIQSKAKKYKGADIFAALHELGHAIETSYVDEAARQEGSENLGKDFYSPLSQQSIPDPVNNATYSNTFRAAIRELLELFGDKKVATGEFTNQDARDIINEVIRMQRTGILEGFGTKFPVRNDYSKGMELVSKGKVTQSKYDTVMREGERTYFHTPYELAADLLGIYMFDPKLAKREMPKATKLVRLLLKDNPNVQFFSAPFSAVVAMVMANMLLAEKEDEEEKALLTLGRGALTA